VNGPVLFTGKSKRRGEKAEAPTDLKKGGKYFKLDGTCKTLSLTENTIIAIEQPCKDRTDQKWRCPGHVLLSLVRMK